MTPGMVVYQIIGYLDYTVFLALPVWAALRFRAWGALGAAVYLWIYIALMMRAVWALGVDRSGAQLFNIPALAISVIALPAYTLFIFVIVTGIATLVTALKAKWGRGTEDDTSDAPRPCRRLHWVEITALALFVLYLPALYSLVPLREEINRHRHNLRLQCYLTDGQETLAFSADNRTPPFFLRTPYRKAIDPMVPLEKGLPNTPAVIVGVQNSSENITFRQLVIVVNLLDERGKRIRTLASRYPSLMPNAIEHFMIPLHDPDIVTRVKQGKMRLGEVYMYGK